VSIINFVVKTTKYSINCKESELIAYVFNSVRTKRLSSVILNWIALIGFSFSSIFDILKVLLFSI